MFLQNLCANPEIDPVPKARTRKPAYSMSQPVYTENQPRSRRLKYARDMQKHLAANNVNDIDSESYTSDSNVRQKRQRISPPKTTNIGSLTNIRNRLEDQTFIINTNIVSEISNKNEEICVNDLLTLYETANAELSPTKRQVIEGLLKQAVDMDSEMKLNVNIIRVSEDFH